MKTFKSRTVHFVSSLRIFTLYKCQLQRLACLYRLFFYSSVATYRHACSENSLSINEKKKAREKSGKWSDIEEIGVRALAQLRVLYSDRARSFYQWPAPVISELFLKDDTFVWVAVFSEFCLQPATAVNVFECPSTSFIGDDQYQYLGNCPPTPLLIQHKP